MSFSRFFVSSHAKTNPYLQLDHPLAKVGCLSFLWSCQGSSEGDVTPIGGRTAGRACSHIPVRWISPSASSRRVLTQPPAPRRRQLQRCPRGFVRGSGLVRSPLPLPRRTGSVTSVGGNYTPMPQSARRGVLAECPHVFLMVAETLSWCVPTSSSLQSSRQI